LFSQWLKIKAKRNESSRQWCRRHGVEEQRLYEMVKLKSQFQDILEDCLNELDRDPGERQYEDRFNQNGVTLNNMREYYDHQRQRSSDHRHHRHHHDQRNDSKVGFFFILKRKFFFLF